MRVAFHQVAPLAAASVVVVASMASATVTRTQLAGEPLADYPYFHCVENFSEDADIHVGVDIQRFPQLLGADAELWVVSAKTAAEWAADPVLVDARGAPTAVSFVGTTIQENTFLVAGPGVLTGNAGAGLGVSYDVVIDVDASGTLGAGDLLDGAGEAPGFWRVRDTTQPGPLFVTERTESAGKFLTQRFYYPTGIATMGELPIVFIGHGWTQLYTWYGYIGRHLASFGYVVVSFRNDPGDGGPAGTETAAATTIDNTDWVLGHLDTLVDGVLDGHVDAHRIVWIGHSTGGEAVVRAHTRLRMGDTVPQSFGLDDIALLSSIAPVNWLTGASVTPADVPYHMFVGAADTDTQGAPTMSYTQSMTIFERATGSRQLTYIHGAGHCDFNESPGSSMASGPDLIGRAATHEVVKGYLLPLVELHAKNNLAGREYFTRLYEDFHPPGIAPNVVIATEYRDAASSGVFVVDDYEPGPVPGGVAVSSSGGAVTFDVGNVDEPLMRDVDSSFDWSGAQSSNGMTRARHAGDTPHCVVFDWSPGAPRFYELEIVPEERDLTDDEFLSFRVAQGTRHPETDALDAPLSFTVTLRDAHGNSSSIDFGAYGRLTRPYLRTGYGSGAGWGNEFSTVRIRLSEFLTNGSGVDLADVAAIRFEFGAELGSARGRIALDDVAIVPSPAPGTVGVLVAGGDERRRIRAVPNPFVSGTTFEIPAGAAAVSARLDIFDVTGRWVRSLVPAFGASFVAWNGRDRLGRPVPAGIYFYRIDAGASDAAAGSVVRVR